MDGSVRRSMHVLSSIKYDSAAHDHDDNDEEGKAMPICVAHQWPTPTIE